MSDPASTSDTKPQIEKPDISHDEPKSSKKKHKKKLKLDSHDSERSLEIKTTKRQRSHQKSNSEDKDTKRKQFLGPLQDKLKMQRPDDNFH